MSGIHSATALWYASRATGRCSAPGGKPFLPVPRALEREARAAVTACPTLALRLQRVADSPR